MTTPVSAVSSLAPPDLDEVRADDLKPRFGLGPWWALLVLTGIYACHSLDRAVVSVVIEPMKAELHLTDSAVGVLVGLGYGLAFALAALPLGVLVDRVNRVRLITGLVAIWSVFTICAGFAQQFLWLLLSRIGVGAAEAGGQPTALSLLSDLFPPHRRATALGVFYVGASIGTAVSFAGGSLIAAHFGWRAAFLLAGLPGLFFAVLLLITVREPRRGQAGQPTSKAPSLIETLRFIGRDAAILHVCLAMVLAAFAVTVMTVWIVPLLMRSHGLTIVQAGTTAALTSAVFAGIGAALAGALSDRLAAKAAYRIVTVPAISMALAAPLMIAIAFVQSAVIAIGLFMVFGLLLSSWTSAGFTSVLGRLPDRMRGTTMSLLQIGCSFIGASLGPLAVGVLSDAIGGHHGLSAAISICSLTAWWSCAHFLLAGRAIRRTTASPEADARRRVTL